MWQQSQDVLRILFRGLRLVQVFSGAEVAGFVPCRSLQSHLFTVDERDFGPPRPPNPATPTQLLDATDEVPAKSSWWTRVTG
ncbi:hypothetical protein ACVWY6_001401 [Williamsia sp. R60]